MEDFRFPKVFPKLLKTAIYFFYLNLLYDDTAWKLADGLFQVNNLSVRFLSLGRFPFEEFFFW